MHNNNKIQEALDNHNFKKKGEILILKDKIKKLEEENHSLRIGISNRYKKIIEEEKVIKSKIDIIEMERELEGIKSSRSNNIREYPSDYTGESNNNKDYTGESNRTIGSDGCISYKRIRMDPIFSFDLKNNLSVEVLSFLHDNYYSYFISLFSREEIIDNYSYLLNKYTSSISNSFSVNNYDKICKLNLEYVRLYLDRSDVLNDLILLVLESWVDFLELLKLLVYSSAEVRVCERLRVFLMENTGAEVVRVFILLYGRDDEELKKRVGVYGCVYGKAMHK